MRVATANASALSLVAKKKAWAAVAHEAEDPAAERREADETRRPGEALAHRRDAAGGELCNAW